LEDKSPNVTRRALIGGFAGLVALGGGIGVVAGINSKPDTPDAPEPKTVTPEPTKETIQKTTEVNTIPEEPDTKPEKNPIKDIENGEYEDIDPDRSEFNKEDIKKEQDEAELVPSTGAKPVGG